MKHVVAVVIVSLCVGLCGCSKSKKPEKKETVRPVKSMLVQAPQHYILRNFPGKVVASKNATLSFQVSGELVQLPILEGDQVKAGQLLAEVDPKPYHDKVLEAEAKYQHAKAQFERAARLVKKDFVSKADYDAALSNYTVAKANLSTAKQNLGYTKLLAPFAGYVAKRYVEKHEFVKINEPIALLQDLTHIDIEISVPENIIIHLQRDKDYNNQHAKPVALFDAAPGREFPLAVKEFSSTADSETQTYRVKFIMEAPKDLNILPGMTTTVQIPIPDFQNAGKSFYVIPSSAVFKNSQDQSAVWVIDPNTMQVSERVVTISRLSDNDIRVLTGLKVGERIVTAGVHFIHAGEKVRLLEDEKKSANKP